MRPLVSNTDRESTPLWRPVRLLKQDAVIAAMNGVEPAVSRNHQLSERVD